MQTGRDALGKIVLLLFVLFNLVMLALAGAAHSLKDTPAGEIREVLLAKFTELGKETQDDRKLNVEEMASIERTVDDVMAITVFLQREGLRGLLVIWGGVALVGGFLLYLTRPQPI